MKAINYLKQIKMLDAKIESDLEDLSQLETLALKTTSVMSEDKVQSSGSQQKMADCVVKIADLKKQLESEIDAYIDFKTEARNLICNVCDADCCKLLHKRYFLYKTWEQIAVEMDYTYQWVSGGLHKRALSQLQKALDGKEQTQ